MSPEVAGAGCDSGAILACVIALGGVGGQRLDVSLQLDCAEGFKHVLEASPLDRRYVGTFVGTSASKAVQNVPGRSVQESGKKPENIG